MEFSERRKNIKKFISFEIGSNFSFFALLTICDFAIDQVLFINDPYKGIDWWTWFC